MEFHRASTGKLPIWLRVAAGFWFLIWFPAYWRGWGGQNFLHFCDIAVIVGCIGFWLDSPLIISSQAVACVLVDLMWALDAGWTLAFHRHLVGGTEYLFNSQYAWWLRLLSCFHMVMPVLMVWAVHRVGYDRRGYWLQFVIALAAFVTSRLWTPPAQNFNYAFADPFFHRQCGSAPVHVLVAFLFMAIVVYLPTHIALSRIFSPPSPRQVIWSGVFWTGSDSGARQS